MRLAATAGFIISALYVTNMNSYSSITIPDQSNKLFVITGSNSGLGYHTAMAIAKQNGKVILACRTESKGEEAKQNILKEAPNAQVEVMKLDLSSFASIKEFVNSFKAKYDSLDVLVNNAGIMALPTRELTKDGLEMQIGTNHFGHFLLTSLMFPLLKQSGRVVNHASSAHMFAGRGWPKNDLLSENYDAWRAYGNSKAANLLFTYELNRRLQRSGNPKNIMCIAVHPGYSATNLQTGRFPLWEYCNYLIAMKAEHGALPQILGTVHV